MTWSLGDSNVRYGNDYYLNCKENVAPSNRKYHQGLVPHFFSQVDYSHSISFMKQIYVCSLFCTRHCGEYGRYKFSADTQSPCVHNTLTQDRRVQPEKHILPSTQKCELMTLYNLCNCAEKL